MHVYWSGFSRKTELTGYVCVCVCVCVCVFKINKLNMDDSLPALGKFKISHREWLENLDWIEKEKNQFEGIGKLMIKHYWVKVWRREKHRNVNLYFGITFILQMLNGTLFSSILRIENSSYHHHQHIYSFDYFCISLKLVSELLLHLLLP